MSEVYQQDIAPRESGFPVQRCFEFPGPVQKWSNYAVGDIRAQTKGGNWADLGGNGYTIRLTGNLPDRGNYRFAAIDGGNHYHIASEFVGTGGSNGTWRQLGYARLVDLTGEVYGPNSSGNLWKMVFVRAQWDEDGHEMSIDFAIGRDAGAEVADVTYTHTWPLPAASPYAFEQAVKTDGVVSGWWGENKTWGNDPITQDGDSVEGGWDSAYPAFLSGPFRKVSPFQYCDADGVDLFQEDYNGGGLVPVSSLAILAPSNYNASTGKFQLFDYSSTPLPDLYEADAPVSLLEPDSSGELDKTLTLDWVSGSGGAPGDTYTYRVVVAAGASRVLPPAKPASFYISADKLAYEYATGQHATVPKQMIVANLTGISGAGTALDIPKTLSAGSTSNPLTWTEGDNQSPYVITGDVLHDVSLTFGARMVDFTTGRAADGGGLVAEDAARILVRTYYTDTGGTVRSHWQELVCRCRVTISFQAIRVQLWRDTHWVFDGEAALISEWDGTPISVSNDLSITGYGVSDSDTQLFYGGTIDVSWSV